jgi:FkbM family methyltransferase
MSTMSVSNEKPLTDYSQYGQSLILNQLITPDTPRIVADIGAHDGISGSNSRGLLEQGWRGVLVEPVPAVFGELRNNCSHFPGVSLVQAACSDHVGTAFMYIGKDGAAPQMSTFSTAPELAKNITGRAIQVNTTTLARLLAEHKIDGDFGVLLVDTEGWDLTVLKGLSESSARPRIIVTEDFAATDTEKYLFLAECNYRFLGNWGIDSFWMAAWHPADVTPLQLPVRRVPSDWLPSGRVVDSARVGVDRELFSYPCLIGWAWTEISRSPDSSVVVRLDRVDSPQRYLFEAWRVPRRDVSSHFGADHLLMSGYRAPIDVPSGLYDMTIIQQGDDFYASNAGGRVRFEADAGPI